MSKLTPKKLEKLRKELRKGRDHYPQEQRYDWLKDLLDAYHIIDAGAKIEIESHLKATGRTLACHEGCSACCMNPTVPINEIELRGISFYTTEIMDEEIYDRVLRQLEEHESTSACPFLVDNRCSIYPFRPIACRIFHVYDKPCELKEDVSKTRPNDILPAHNPDYARMVSDKLLPHMGIANNDKRKAFESGYMFQNTRAMHTFDWKWFADNSRKIKKLIQNQ
jgi:uncharacterized protein